MPRRIHSDSNKMKIKIDWSLPDCMNCSHRWYFHKLNDDSSLENCVLDNGMFGKAKKLNVCLKNCSFYLNPNTVVQGE